MLLIFLFLNLVFLTTPKLQIASSQYIDHDPIFIGSNDELKGWPGEGTPSNPYLIEGLSITGPAPTMIEIQNVNYYVNISNCLISGGSWVGIYLYNTQNIRIIDNTIHNNQNGVLVDSSESILIDKNIISANGWSGVELHSVSNSLISYNEVFGNEWLGINGIGCENSVFEHNEVYDNHEGIGLIDSSNNLISNNIAYHNLFAGASIMESIDCDNEISGNILYENLWGAVVRYARRCTVSNNQIYNNRHAGIMIGGSGNNKILDNSLQNDGIYLFSKVLDDWFQAEVSGNTVNGKPIIYWQDVNGGTVPFDAGQVILVNCNDIHVVNQNLSNVNCGLLAALSSNLFIQNNIFSKNNGDWLENLWLGPYKGLWVVSCENALISNNSFQYNFDGIRVYYSNSTTISHNNIENNDQYGLFLYSSSYYNTITNNRIRSNVLHGIYIENADDNDVKWNNFIDNNGGGASQAYDDSQNNLFGSNHWSSHISPDNDNDGIVDIPYNIEGSASNYDQLPYVNEILWGQETPAGVNVEVRSELDEVAIIFPEILEGGTTTVTTSDTGPDPPTGFEVAGQYYDVTTTTTYSGTISVTFSYDENNLQGPEEELRLWHWEDSSGDWVDVTTWVDTDGNIIYGEVSSLSKFAIMEDIVAPVITADLILLDIDDDEGLFQFIFSASDNFDPFPSIHAVLLLPQLENPEIEYVVDDEIKIEFDIKDNELEVSAPDPEVFWSEIQMWGGLKVDSGQLFNIELDDNSEEIEFKFSNGILKIEEYSPTLRVTAQDAAGNIAVVMISPVFDSDDGND